MTFLALALATTSLAYPMAELEAQSEPAKAFKAFEDDEVDWYKPVAVILKPASEKDLQKRFEAMNADDESFSSDSQHYQPVNPFSPTFQDSYKGFNPYASYQQARGEEDRLRDFYQSYGVPERTQGNLLSLARLGLIAIPKKEVKAQYSANEEQGKLM